MEHFICDYHTYYNVGNARTVMNSNATRFSQLISLDFDTSGLIASVSIQVFYKNRAQYDFNYGTLY